MRIPRQAREVTPPLGPSLGLAEADAETFAERLDAACARLDGAAVSVVVTEHVAAARVAQVDAGLAIRGAGSVDDLVAALGVLTAGRRRLAQVEGYLVAEDPADGPPCFFDPAHGPSARDATWTSVRYGTRRVPACLADAVMLAAGVPPDRRTVLVDGRAVAYWEPVDEVLPYLLGCFPGHPLIDWLVDRGTRLPRGVLPPPGIYGEAPMVL